MNHEPIKPLFEDAGAPSELRNFVTLARSDGASQAELDRLAKRMAPVLGVSAAFIASSAAAVGTTAPITATGAFGAPASGLTPALGAVSAAKVGAASAAKVGLLSQLMASASAKVLAVSLSIGAAGAAVYNATTEERPPSGPQVPVARPSESTKSRTLPGAGAVAPAESATPPALADNPVPAAAAAPIAAVAEPAPQVAQLPVTRAARASTVVRKPAIARQLPQVPAPAEPAAPASEHAIVDQPVAVEKPSLPPPSELSLIEHAEASRLHPNEALAFLAKHEEIYPRGALAQEREVLAIELLLKAGRLSQAETRAERFEDAYPSSAHLPHLRALLTRASAK